jgi:hypothetical protein
MWFKIQSQFMTSISLDFGQGIMRGLHRFGLGFTLRSSLIASWLPALFVVAFYACNTDGLARSAALTQNQQASEERTKELSTLETYLYQANLSDGEVALRLELDESPEDDNVRFSLGMIQFFRAIENLGQALYEYGALSDRLSEPILRLSVPQNSNPSELSLQEFGRVLDAFRNELLEAERTLAEIDDDQVKISLKLARATLRISPNQAETISLSKWMQDLRIDVPVFLKRNPELEIHFDRGDVPWLRAYCHATSAFVEFYRSIDLESGFEDIFKGVFPRIKPNDLKRDEQWGLMVKLNDKSRLRRAREHLIAVCQLNHESWKHIRLETDDDLEWLSHPGQTDQLGIPVTNEQIDAWLGMMEQIEGLLTGDRLISGDILSLLNPKYDQADGLNLRRVLDNPPEDLFNISRIQAEGIDSMYIERNSDKPKFDMAAIFAVIRLFNGPFGVAQAARLN